MDAENRVDGEDGQQGQSGGEAQPAPAAEALPPPSTPEEGPPGGGEAGSPGEPGAEVREEQPALPSPEQAEAVMAGEVRRLNHSTVTHVPLEQLDEDATYRLRSEDDVSALATDVARLGQLFPVDVRPVGENRYQVVCGFRRVAALRFLKRDRALVRIHTQLSDEDALLMSLAAAIHASAVEPEALAEKRTRLEAEGRLSAPVRDMLQKALETEDTLAPEGVEEEQEVDADQLADDVTQRLGDINQDLSLLADVFGSLDDARREELLNQLRYSAQLVAYLEGQ